MKKIFVIVNSYESKEDFGTDPFGYYIELDKLILKRFGDDYHDDGNAKCHAWIQGYVSGKNISDYEIKYEERADYDD